MTNIKKETAEGWLKVAIKEIQKRIKKLKVEETSQLYNSLNGAIQEISGGSSYKAEILYNYYGIFPDMGVGNGVSMGDATANKLTGGTRKRKPWTRAIAGQAHRFGELMGEAYAKHAVEKIKGSIQEKIVIGM